MDPWTKSVLFTRQQVAELSGVSDGVLTFWIRNGLLVATSGGQGRGSHRKFAPIQVSIAALLGALQQIGLQISTLKALSQLLQRGVSLCAESALHPFSLTEAARHAHRLGRIADGEKVNYWDREKGDHRETKDPKVLERAMLAERMEYDPPELIIELSRTMLADDYDAVQLYTDIRAQMEDLNWSDAGWLLWQDSASRLRVGHQSEPSAEFVDYPDAETGIFLAAARIIRRVWGIDPEARKREREIRRLAHLRDLAARKNA